MVHIIVLFVVAAVTVITVGALLAVILASAQVGGRHRD